MLYFVKMRDGVMGSLLNLYILEEGRNKKNFKMGYNWPAGELT